MADACCALALALAPAPAPAPVSAGEPVARMPWWKDRSVQIPISSGLALLTGLITAWSGLETVALVMFWAALLLGASQFAPNALRALVTRRRLGISLLMTISATGAVILGYIEAAAALAFLYSIAEALERSEEHTSELQSRGQL